MAIQILQAQFPLPNIAKWSHVLHPDGISAKIIPLLFSSKYDLKVYIVEAPITNFSIEYGHFTLNTTPITFRSLKVNHPNVK